jgi:hypothetical protein
MGRPASLEVTEVMFRRPDPLNGRLAELVSSEVERETAEQDRERVNDQPQIRHGSSPLLGVGGRQASP